MSGRKIIVRGPQPVGDATFRKRVEPGERTTIQGHFPGDLGEWMSLWRTPDHDPRLIEGVPAIELIEIIISHPSTDYEDACFLVHRDDARSGAIVNSILLLL